MDSTIPTAKEVVVAPLAVGREAVGLAAAIALILLLSGLRFVQVAPQETGVRMQAYQMQDIKLKNQAPILYRTLLGAVDSIALLREEDGRWPDVAELREENLPPFASSLLPTGLRGFNWEMRQGASWVDYYGVNKDAAKIEQAGGDPLESSFILRIVDLKVGKYPYPLMRQEKGRENRFAAQIWINPANVDYPEGMPAERGWKWIVSGSLALEEKIN